MSISRRRKLPCIIIRVSGIPNLSPLLAPTAVLAKYYYHTWTWKFERSSETELSSQLDFDRLLMHSLKRSLRRGSHATMYVLWRLYGKRRKDAVFFIFYTFIHPITQHHPLDPTRFTLNPVDSHANLLHEGSGGYTLVYTCFSYLHVPAYPVACTQGAMKKFNVHASIEVFTCLLHAHTCTHTCKKHKLHINKYINTCTHVYNIHTSTYPKSASVGSPEVEKPGRRATEKLCPSLGTRQSQSDRQSSCRKERE